MREMKEAPRLLGPTEQKGLVDGPSGKIGWDVAVLVVVGGALALVGVTLLVVGFLMH
jgi:hypothetical protein